MMRRDVHRARHEPNENKRQQLVDQSIARRVARTTQLGSLNLVLAEQLPVADHEVELRDLIADHQVVVVAGETGSGKTAACAVPLVQMVDPSVKAIAALVIVPRGNWHFST